MSQSQAVKSSQPSPRLGVFLCECGSRIVPKIDQAVVAQLLEESHGTVESFMKTMATLGPIERDDEIQSRLQVLYDALQVSRVRWVLGGQPAATLGNRLPQPHAQPGGL